jgi:flagellar biosynthesis/type III secretory pathway protein FliH
MSTQQGSPTEARKGRVVKKADARAEPLYPASRLLKGAVTDAEQSAAEARRERETALAEAAAERKAAKEEADSVRRAAFEHGAKEAAAEFAQMLKKLDDEIEAMKKRFANDVQRVAFRFAKAVLDVEFQAKPERLVQLIGKVIQPARLYHRVKIHLHPDDVDRVKADQAQIIKQLAFVRDLQIVPSDDLPPHGVRVETEMGSYDGNVDTQIRRLQEHLLPGSEPFGDPDSVPDQE